MVNFGKEGGEKNQNSVHYILPEEKESVPVLDEHGLPTGECVERRNYW